MSSSLDVTLVYGLDLGDADGGWNIEYDDDDNPKVGSWYSSDDEERDDFPTLAITAYLRLKGVAFEPYGSYRALKEFGLELTSYGALEYWSGYILTAFDIDGDSAVYEIDPAELQQDTAAWDAKIQDFLTTLEIQATKKPGWLICADYG